MEISTILREIMYQTTNVQIINEYADYLSKRNRSPATIEHYRYVLGRCLDILSDHGRPCIPEMIGEDEIAEIMRSLDVRENTMKNFITVFGRMCEHYTGRNLVKEMGLLWNRGHVTRKFICKEEMARLLSEADPVLDPHCIGSVGLLDNKSVSSEENELIGNEWVEHGLTY